MQRRFVSGDLSIISSNPSENDYIPAYSPTFFEATVSNLDSSISDAREMLIGMFV